MNNDADFNNGAFIVTDPKEGAKVCKRVGYPVNGETVSSNSNDVTKSEMFRELFGNDGVKQFEQIKKKEDMKKSIVIDNGLKNKTEEVNNKESEIISDSH